MMMTTAAVVDRRPKPDRQTIECLISQPEQYQESQAFEHFEILLQKLKQPRHLSGDACTAICFYVEQCRQSESKRLQAVAFSRMVCINLFNYYLEWHEKTQQRSMRHIIELVASLIKLNPDLAIANDVRTEILGRSLAIVSHESSQPFVKPAFKALDILLSKQALTVAEIMASFLSRRRTNQADNQVPAYQDPELFGHFISELFSWMELPDVAPAAGKLIVVLFEASERDRALSTQGAEGSASHRSGLWQKCILDGLTRYPNCTENIKHHLIHPLFKLDRKGSQRFLKQIMYSMTEMHGGAVASDTRYLLFVSVLETGKKLGMIQELDEPRDTSSSSGLQLPKEALDQLLTHPDNAIRNATFTILISSASSTRPFGRDTLKLLQTNLAMLHAETDAKSRNEVWSNTKHMIERLRDSTHLMSRNTQSVSSSSTKKGQRQASGTNVEGAMRDHAAFLAWNLSFLCDELVPTASYQRHVTALRILEIIGRSGVISLFHNLDVIGLQIVTPSFGVTLRRLLLDLFMDPFEDVRTTAAALSKSMLCMDFFRTRLPPRSPHDGSMPVDPQLQLKLVQACSKKANLTAERTGRADLADGAARFVELAYWMSAASAKPQFISNLISQLEKRVALAQEDLAGAVEGAPIHGSFISLRMLWESNSTSADSLELLQECQRRTVELISDIWKIVKNVLCNDSPEGLLLMDVNDTENIDTKDLLSYSFRAIHESSTLMAAMVSKMKAPSTSVSITTNNQLLAVIGDLSFEQLSTLRHRGAFSTVASTFAKCCQMAQVLAESNTPSSLLRKWYEGANHCILQQVSTTRRSAGIPALITGILSANASVPSFDSVMLDMQKLSSMPVTLSEVDDANLPQVHATNCLKDIFKNALLRKQADKHISNCLKLAADGLESDTWAIRNCNLILLRSIIDCLFGTSESKHSSESGWDGGSLRISYERYESLPDLLLGLLRKQSTYLDANDPVDTQQIESVFPALDIVRRAGPPPEHRVEIFDLVLRHLSSEVWHVRDIAARTLSTLLLHVNWIDQVRDVFQTSELCPNQIHGVLLATKYALLRNFELHEDRTCATLSSLSNMLLGHLGAKILALQNPYVEAAYEELLNAVLQIYLHIDSIKKFPTDDIQCEGLDSLLNSQPTATYCCALLSKTDVEHVSADHALLRQALLTRLVMIGVVSKDLGDFETVAHLFIKKDIDGARNVLSTALDPCASFWKETRDLSMLIACQFRLLSGTDQIDIRIEIYRNIIKVLQKILDSETILQDDITTILSEHVLSAEDVGSPKLVHEEIHISGYMMLALLQTSHRSENLVYTASHFLAWGIMVGELGKSEHDFDVRLKAAESLAAVYGRVDVQIIKKLNTACLPSMMAIYDALNDDDEEIREVAAKALRFVNSQVVVPLTAKKLLIEFLMKIFTDNEEFGNVVVARILNCGQPTMGKIDLDTMLDPEVRLRRAMVADESLFIKEEQNLYVDEVREILLWVDIAKRSSPVTLQAASSSLKNWALHGLEALEDLLSSEDDALGYASRPEVFAIITSILASVDVMFAWREEAESSGLLLAHKSWVDEAMPKFCTALASLRQLARTTNLHPTLLDQLELQHDISEQFK